MNSINAIRRLVLAVLLLIIVQSSIASNSAMLSGRLTVGGPNANYNTITAAINDLKSNGMSANVVLDINQAYGPYVDQLNIENIPGLSANAKLTIKGNNSVIKNLFSGSTNVYIIKLAASNVTIDGFVFEVYNGTSDDKNVAIICTQNSNYNQIINNKFKLKKSFSSNNQVGILFSGTLNFSTYTQGEYKYNIIENNFFEGSRYPIYILGKSASIQDRGNEIKNNKFSDFVGSAIYSNYVDSLIITSNDVFHTSSFKNTTHVGVMRFVHILNGAESFKIRNNRIYDLYNNTQNSGGFHVFYFVNCGVMPTGKEVYIENNIIYNSGSYGPAIFCYVTGTLNGIRILHNSFALQSPNLSYIIYLSLVPNFTNNHYQNNLFNSTNNNVVLFGIGANSFFTGIKSDNNAYCTNFSQIQFTASSQYQTWRATYQADSNSLFINQQNLNAPYYLVPDSFSTILGAGKNVSTTLDYWNNIRNNLKPSIGAFEKSYSDNVAPILTLYKINSTLSKNSRQINNILQIFESSGIDTSFGIRFYYKKRSSINKFISNTNADEGWKYVKPNYNNIYSSFYINYQLFKDSIVNAGDTIDFFVIAKDNFGNYGVHNKKIENIFLLNLGVTDVIREIAPDYYIISEVIPDTVYVGTTHKFKSLTKEGGLFSYLKENYANKDIQVLIDSDLEENGRYGLENLLKISGKSSKLRIDAKLNKAITIQGSCKGGLIRFEGIDSLNWSANSDSITVRNNYFSLRNDTVAAFYIGANNLDKSNTSNAIQIKNTIIQTNPNSIFTTGIYFGKKNGVIDDQSYQDVSILNNKFSQSKNGLIFGYANSFVNLNYINFKIIDNEFEFDSLVNVISASYTSSLLLKGNIVKANHLSWNLILTNTSLQNSHRSIFHIIYPFGTTNISSNKIVLKNTKNEGINIIDVSRGYNVNVNNNIIDVDDTRFNVNRSNLYSFVNLETVNFAHNASLIRNENYDNDADDICFIKIIDIDSLSLLNNLFVNNAKHQSFYTRLMSFSSTRPRVFIRNNYLENVNFTDDYFVNSKTSINEFQMSVDSMMNFIYDDANFNSNTYKSQNNVLVSNGVNVPGVNLDIDDKNRKFIPTIGPYELDSINVDVELMNILINQCIDTSSLNYKIALVIRNNSNAIDSAKLKVKISSTDTSTLSYLFTCNRIAEHEIDTVYISFNDIKNFVNDTSLYAKLELMNDQNNSNNSLEASFRFGQNLVSNLINAYVDTLCRESQIEIDLVDELDRVYKWYDAAEYGNLLYEGKKYIVNNDSKLNVYAEVQPNDLVEKATMPVAYGPLSTKGTYFTIKNTSNAVLNIRYLSLMISQFGYYNNTKVFVKQGRYTGFENIPSAWTDTTVRSIAVDKGYLGLEFVDGGINVLSNDSVSFYVHIANTTGAFINENITNGINKYNTQDFEIKYGMGAGDNSPFSTNLVTNRKPGLKIYYLNSNKCNKAIRIPINIKKQKNIISNIKPISQNIIKSAGTYNNPDVICYYSDNIYSIDISDDFKNYVYNQDWVITKKEVKRNSSINPDNLNLDTSKKILINKSSLIIDSIYRLTYWYTDKISGCSISISRFFKYGRNIGRSLALTGTVKKCSFDSVELNAFNNVSYFKYLWSTGDTTRTIYAKKPGKYFLTTYFPFCFQKTDSVIIVDLPEQDSLAIYVDQLDTCNFKFFTDQSANYTVEWDFGDGTKAVGFEVMHRYAFNTIYKVQLRRLTSVPYCLKKNISEQLVDVTCMPMSIENSYNENILVYPIPSKDKIYIESKENITSIVLYDINGRFISKYQESIIDLNKLSNGVYILEINANDKVYRKRVLKN